MNPGVISGENCYVVQDEKTKETMIIDPGELTEDLIKILDAMQIKLKYILLTHCHGDHIAGVQKIKEKYGGQVLIHRKDENGLRDININLSTHIGLEPITIQEDSRVDDNDILHVGELEFVVIHTPGHTARKYMFIF